MEFLLVILLLLVAFAIPKNAPKWIQLPFFIAYIACLIYSFAPEDPMLFIWGMIMGIITWEIFKISTKAK